MLSYVGSDRILSCTTGFRDVGSVRFWRLAWCDGLPDGPMEREGEPFRASLFPHAISTIFFFFFLGAREKGRTRLETCGLFACVGGLRLIYRIL